MGGRGLKQPPSKDRRKTSRHVVLLALLCIINVHKQKNKLLWMGHGLVSMGTPPSHTSPPQRGQRLDLDVDFKPPPLRFSGYAAGLQRSLRSHGERRKEGGQEKNGGRRLTDFRGRERRKARSSVTADIVSRNLINCCSCTTVGTSCMTSRKQIDGDL